MSYRLPSTLPEVREPPALAFSTGRPLHITVDNNTITRINVPCFYARRFTRRDRMIWDHMTWPYPGHPDRSDYSQVLAVQDVNLEDEGYTEVEVLYNSYDMTMTGVLDHNHVVLTITTDSVTGQYEDKHIPFAIYITGHNDEVGDMKDLVTKGVLHIIADLKN